MLRPDLPFWVEPARGDVKGGQTRGTKASRAGELPAVGAYSGTSKMEHRERLFPGRLPSFQPSAI